MIINIIVIEIEDKFYSFWEIATGQKCKLKESQRFPQHFNSQTKNLMH